MGALTYPLIVIMWLAWLSLISAFVVHKARPARKQRDGVPLRPAAERREPRDLTRPYPKPESIAKEDERLTVCPVCGMEDPYLIDGELMGWPAHGTCAEWLGEWRAPTAGTRKLEPIPAAAKTASRSATLAGRMAKAYGLQADWLDTAPQGGALGGTAAAHPALFTREGAVQRTADAVNAWVEAANTGAITPDELREWITSVFGYPEMVVTVTGRDAGTCTCDCGMSFHGTIPALDESMETHRSSGQHEQRIAYLHRMQRALPGAVTHMWYPCGKPFDGTPEGVRQAMGAHRASGECPHSARHREA